MRRLTTDKKNASVLRYLACGTAIVLGCLANAFAAPEAAKKNSAAPQGVPAIVDAVVASVDEKPITLRELQSRISPARQLSLKDLSSDHEALQTLDLIISERVFEAEATQKRVSVADSEVEDYINEVAARNSLSRKDFEGVLTREGKNLDWYKRQVKNDILKTKIASTLSHGGVSVTEQEIDEYLSTSSSFSSEGPSLKLRLISIPTSGKTPEQVAEKVKLVQDALESGEEFEQVAKKYSEGPHAADGGLLGVVAEKDLSSQIFDTVLSIEPGHYSKPVSTESETQIFFVEERFGASDDDENESEESQEAKRDEARKAIQKRKTDEKLSSYFAVELNKNHTIDKKF